jgi:hypothetical protein
LQIEPDWPRQAAATAWRLATSPEAAQRNGPEAVRLARQACQAAGQPEPELLDTLAAALAEAGCFTEAQATARQALAVPGLTSDQAEAIRARLAFYAMRAPFREPAQSPAALP